MSNENISSESMPRQSIVSIGRPKGWDKFVEGVIVVKI